MILKQLWCAGVESWLLSDAHTQLVPVCWTSDGETYMYLHLKVYLGCTDQRPDQVGAEKLMMGDVEQMLLTLTLREWCNRHQLHLMKQRQLQRHPLYYSVLCQAVKHLAFNIKTQEEVRCMGNALRMGESEAAHQTADTTPHYVGDGVQSMQLKST